MAADKTADNPVDQTDEMWTTTQVARYLGVNDARIRVYCQNGVFPNVIMTPLGRLFSPAEVKEIKASRDATAAARLALR
jgi:hypothetical protein